VNRIPAKRKAKATTGPILQLVQKKNRSETPKKGRRQKKKPGNRRFYRHREKGVADHCNRSEGKRQEEEGVGRVFGKGTNFREAPGSAARCC